MNQTRHPALVSEVDAKESEVIEDLAVSSPPKDLRTLKASGDAIEKALFQEQVRSRAYELWEVAGCPPGDGSDFWAEAERELSERRSS